MFFDRFLKNNTKMLEKAMMKSIFVAVGDSSGNLRHNIINKRSIIQVEEVARERVTPEPGEDEQRFNHVIVQTNEDTDMTYIFLDRTMFENMEQEQIDELVYQTYDQLDFSQNGETEIHMLDEKGEVQEINISHYSGSYAADKKEEPSEDEKSDESCSSEDAKQQASKQIQQAQEDAKTQDEQQEKKEEITALEKAAHPKYSTSNAKFQKDMKSNSNVNSFKGRHGETKVTNADLKEIHQVEAILEHSIQGSDGDKSNSIAPAKRLNMRNIITEASEKEYITNKGEEGKNIKINMIIDRSGSMNGSPTYNSNLIIMALNNLSFKYPELDVSIIYSCTGSNFKIDLPVHEPDSEQVWTLDGHGGAEGLHRTMTEHFARLKESDINLVYTDGSIQDDAIDKKYMESQEVELIGLYTNADFKAEDVMKHYEKCQKYFTKTIIREEALSLVNELANMLYLAKNTG